MTYHRGRIEKVGLVGVHLVQRCPCLSRQNALLLLLSWWLSWQLRLVLIILPDATATVNVTLVHGLFLLVRMTKEIVPLEVVLTVQDVEILVVSHPEVENKVESRSG